MFLNSFYTDGYTCRVSFCRKIEEQLPYQKVQLDLEDFNQAEVRNLFRPCTVDPGRKDAFVSYHDNDQIRKLSTSEYYCMSRSVGRQAKEDDLKKEQGLKIIETNIPSPKTTSGEIFLGHITYLLNHLTSLFRFYDIRTVEIKWKNYRGKQVALDEGTNILLNGSKKYNKKKCHQTKRNRKKRRKMHNRRNPGVPHQLVELRYTLLKIIVQKRTHKSVFNEGDTAKMPLVVFGDGLKNKSSVNFRGHRHGVSEKIYQQLKRKQNLGEVLVVDINEFRTSSVCSNCFNRDFRNYKPSSDDFPIHQILICNSCNIYWNRDVMAAKNMFHISSEIWSGNVRPDIFSRQSATTNVVVPLSE